MRPSEEGLREFCRLYEQLHGVPLDPETANEIASRLLTLFELLARIQPGEKNKS